MERIRSVSEAVLLVALLAASHAFVFVLGALTS